MAGCADFMVGLDAASLRAPDRGDDSPCPTLYSLISVRYSCTLYIIINLLVGDKAVEAEKRPADIRYREVAYPHVIVSFVRTKG